MGCKLGSLVVFGALSALLSGVGGTTPAAAEERGPDVQGRCGGWLALSCRANEWCEYDVRGSCGNADIQGKCKPRPEICPMYCAEVTGCDGKRYCNACLAHQAGTDVKREPGDAGAGE